MGVRYWGGDRRLSSPVTQDPKRNISAQSRFGSDIGVAYLSLIVWQGSGLRRSAGRRLAGQRAQLSGPGVCRPSDLVDGRWAQQRGEVVGAQGVRLDRTQSPNGGRAGRVVQQRHFAEEVADTKLGDPGLALALGVDDLALAIGQDVEAVACRALLDDSIPWRVAGDQHDR